MSKNIPTHLTCPYCPSQSFPAANFILRTSDLGRVLVTRFECAAKHCFYTQEKETDDSQQGRAMEDGPEIPEY